MTTANPDPIPARLAALKTTPTAELKRQWRDLFGTEPPAFNRRYLESRLAYRIQELTYGGLRPETLKRLQALGEQLDGGNIANRRTRADVRPIAGTRLLREWQGVEHIVTVTVDGFEWQGGPSNRCRPLRAQSPAPAGTAGCSSALRATGGRHEQQGGKGRPEAALRRLHKEEQRGRAGAGVQFPSCATGSLRGLCRQPEVRGLGADPRPV